MIRRNLYILILIQFINSSFGQALNVSDFRKAFRYDKPTEHKQLLLKGFRLLNDTVSTNQKKFRFSKPDTKETVELTFTEDGEGGEYLSIVYFLPTEFSYKNFVSTLAVYKFKYSKRNKRYQLPTSSYSGENIYINGLIQTNGKKYYSLKYDRYVGKELSGPRPEFRNNRIPIVDSIIKPK